MRYRAAWIMTSHGNALRGRHHSVMGPYLWKHAPRRWVCCAQAFQEYVIMILTRVNTITGVAYSDDPTIFALELANEPHTSDDYETIRGVSPGLLVKAWMEVIVKTIRVVDKNHMVSSLPDPKTSCEETFLHTRPVCRSEPRAAEHTERQII